MMGYLVLIFLGYIIYSLAMIWIKKEEVLIQKETMLLRKETQNILKDDIMRIWLRFYESFLYVHINAKSMPATDEFLEFRSNFIKMFNIVIGQKQCEHYYKIYGDKKHFELYLEHYFEKLFNSKFINLITEISSKE
jgi:hypothetical protein